MMGETRCETYSQLFAPMIQRFEVAAAIGGSAQWNHLGSRASAELLKEIAIRFDDHVKNDKFAQALATAARNLLEYANPENDTTGAMAELQAALDAFEGGE